MSAMKDKIMPLSTIFQLHVYHGGKFYWWRKSEYPEKTTVILLIIFFFHNLIHVHVPGKYGCS